MLDDPRFYGNNLTHSHPHLPSSLSPSLPIQAVQAFGDEKLALVSLLLAHGELYIADRVLLSDRAGELMAFHSPLAGAPPLPHPIYMNPQ